MHYSDPEPYERSRYYSERHTDPRKRSNIGLDQIWWQQEPYVSRKIYLYSVSVRRSAPAGHMDPLDSENEAVLVSCWELHSQTVINTTGMTSAHWYQYR